MGGPVRGISRTELAETLCESLDWKRPSGRLKGVEGPQFLEEFEAVGIIRLPNPRQGKPKGARAKAGRSDRGDAQTPIQCKLNELGGVVLRHVATPKDRALWKELIDRYH